MNPQCTSILPLFSCSFTFSPHRQIFLTEVLELNEIKFCSTQSTVTLVHRKLFRGQLTNSVQLDLKAKHVEVTLNLYG